MICSITMLPTINRWKGKPIHKAVINTAKIIRERTGRSTREALISLQKKFRRDFTGLSLEGVSEADYLGFINDWLEAEREL